MSGVSYMPSNNGTHRNGQSSPARSSSSSSRREEYVDTVVGHDIDDKLATPIKNLLANDYPLANLERVDREYFRLLADNIALYLKEQYPPEDSVVQGDVGAALLEDPSYRKTALSQQKRHEIETVLMTMFARTGRGVGGWQQDKLSENIETQRIEDDRRDEQDEQGWAGRLFG
jgi:hypothetical protein